MKIYLLLLACLLSINTLQAQDDDSLRKGQVFQLGYITEMNPARGGANNNGVLRGMEMNVKFMLIKHSLSNGRRLLSPYFETGYSYFPSSDYKLGQLSAGLGFTCPFIFINLDLGVGGVWYHGEVYGESWRSKKIDAGFYVGAHIPFGRGNGIYAKYWSPGILTSMSDKSYSSPQLFSVGIQL